ncbi:hypothetical protein T5B8_03696 [Salinisphaera sp. T5B8]|uniref:DUF1353 domain-containing protein n=1 Tax=Salinisphaera sp. T5B8 TaxID=1304154 RepID=UPI003341F7D5
MWVVAISAAGFVALCLAPVALAWHEARQYTREIRAAMLEREYGPIPETSRRLSIKELLKGVRGQRGEPIFVVPFAELRRVNVEGTKTLDPRIDDKQFVTLTPVTWTLDLAYDLLEGSAPDPYSGQLGPGVLTDFASIPGIARGLVGQPTGPIVRAAIAHDYGYRCDVDRSAKRRKAWDQTLLKLMRRDGLAPLARVLIYWAVRLFGKSAWKSGGRLLIDDSFQQSVADTKRITERVIADFPTLFDDQGKPIPAPARTGYKPSIYANVIAAQQAIQRPDNDSK